MMILSSRKRSTCCRLVVVVLDHHENPCSCYCRNECTCWCQLWRSWHLTFCCIRRHPVYSSKSLLHLNMHWLFLRRKTCSFWTILLAARTYGIVLQQIAGGQCCVLYGETLDFRFSISSSTEMSSTVGMIQLSSTGCSLRTWVLQGAEPAAEAQWCLLRM